MTRSGLSRRQRSEPDSDGKLLALTQEEAGWQYVSFSVWRLSPGDRLEAETGDE